MRASLNPKRSLYMKVRQVRPVHMNPSKHNPCTANAIGPSSAHTSCGIGLQVCITHYERDREIEREKERDRERKREREKERDRER